MDTVRLKLTSQTYKTNIQFLKVRSGKVEFFSQDYKRMHISSITSKPTEMVFKLEQASSKEDVIGIVKKCAPNKNIEEV